MSVVDAGTWVRRSTEAGGEAWASGRYEEAARAYAEALARIGESDEEVDGARLRARQRECWHRVIDELGGTRVEIPLRLDRASTLAQLPAVFVPGGAGRRPLVVIDHGDPDVSSGALDAGGAAAGARGWHWLTFDGPGRAAALHDLCLWARPDWSGVLAAVLDAAAARADVDAGRIAVIATGRGAGEVERALAAEHRFAAAALVSPAAGPQTALAAVPAALHDPLAAGDRDGFDRELHLAELFDPGIGALLGWRARAFGGGRRPLYEALRGALISDQSPGECTRRTQVLAMTRLDANLATAWLAPALS